MSIVLIEDIDESADDDEATSSPLLMRVLKESFSLPAETENGSDSNSNKAGSDRNMMHHFPKAPSRFLLFIAFVSIYIMGYLSAEMFRSSHEQERTSKPAIEEETIGPKKDVQMEIDTLVDDAADPADKPEVSKMDEEVPHVVFDDLRYRRVCAPVHSSSVLCMTVRHPFPVPEQNPNVTYVDPVNDRVYDLNKKAFRFVDGDELDACKSRTTHLIGDIDHIVKDCLDQAALDPMSFREVVVAVWTRRKHGKTELFGTNRWDQAQHIDDYFDKNVVMVLGDSRTPGVTRELIKLFGNCSPVGAAKSSVLCTGHKSPSGRRLKHKPYTAIPDDATYIGMEAYHPTHVLKRGKPLHKLPTSNLTVTLPKLGLAREPGWTELRNLTIIIDFPIAHSQNQVWMFNEWDKLVEVQRGLPTMMMSIATDSGREALAEMGFRLHNMIVFDGMPQHFPSVTGGYHPEMVAYGKEEELLAKGMYPGWFPELGSKCRGPLPPDNKQKDMNNIVRQSFEDNGFDMNWYGRTWEFANLFWWQSMGWDAKRLHCSHAGRNGGGYFGTQRFFLQAMVDGSFE